MKQWWTSAQPCKSVSSLCDDLQSKCESGSEMLDNKAYTSVLDTSRWFFLLLVWNAQVYSF